MIKTSFILMCAAAITLILLVDLLIGLYSSFPLTPTAARKIMAGIFVGVVICWFWAELAYGGGDPNKR